MSRLGESAKRFPTREAVQTGYLRDELRGAGGKSQTRGGNRSSRGNIRTAFESDHELFEVVEAGQNKTRAVARKLSWHRGRRKDVTQVTPSNLCSLNFHPALVASNEHKHTS